jgi:DNA-binding CsgD family transcriptional regulator
MNAAAAKLTMRPLRVAVLTADPSRLNSLSQLVRDFGHLVVARSERPTVILSDGTTAWTGHLPTVALGGGNASYQARLPSDASPEQIDAALRAVAAGLSVRIAEDLGDGFEAVEGEDERVLLTPREVEVLTAVSNGLSNKEIARALAISQHTVKFHLESLMRKLGVSSRAEAVSKSMRRRLLRPFRV